MKMTNAEELAKDINLMKEVFRRFNCGSTLDPRWEEYITKELLESEVTEDD